jgi:hypothetical protein
MAHSSIRGSTESTPPKRPGEPCCALVDAALPHDELVRAFGIRLVHARVSHDAAPLAPGPFVGLGRVRGATNDGGERVFPIRNVQPLRAQSPARSLDFPSLRRPPCHQAVHGGQVRIDRTPVGWSGSRPMCPSQQAVPNLCRAARRSEPASRQGLAEGNRGARPRAFRWPSCRRHGRGPGGGGSPKT